MAINLKEKKAKWAGCQSGRVRKGIQISLDFHPIKPPPNILKQGNDRAVIWKENSSDPVGSRIQGKETWAPISRLKQKRWGWVWMSQGQRGGDGDTGEDTVRPSDADPVHPWISWNGDQRSLLVSRLNYEPDNSAVRRRGTNDTGNMNSAFDLERYFACRILT